MKTRFAPLLALALSVGTAWASDTPADAHRLLESRSAERYTLNMEGTSVRAGGAMIVVNAPASRIKELVTDYSQYQNFMPGFQTSRVLGRAHDTTDVYLKVPILHGAASVWAVTRFGAPVAEDTGERIDGRKAGPGNVDDLRATWHIRPLDDSHTLLKLELLLVPKLTFPTSLITSQLAESAEDAVRACRERLEGRPAGS